MPNEFLRATLIAATLIWAPVRAPARPAPVAAAELPKEVSSVVTVTTQMNENQIHTQLDGKTQGFFIADIQVETRGGFHIYADRLEFWTESDPWLEGREWTVQIIDRPPSTRFLDPITKTLKEGYQGQSVFRVKLSLPHAVEKPIPLGHVVPLVTSFQACSDKLCFLPVALKSGLATTRADEKTAAPDRGLLENAIGIFRRNLGDSTGLSLFSVLVVLLAGIITAFTPCVYPLYPITLGIFARWSQSSGANPLALALSYCAGLTFSYAAIGLLSSATGAVFGSLTQTAPFLIGVGSLILLSAIFFSGLITFPMPRFLTDFFSKSDAGHESPRSTAQLSFKAALMGAGLGIVASPCVGPVLVVILAWLGSSHASYLKGFGLLSLFGAGMSLPFLILGHFILRLGKRPSLGRYTPFVKHAGTVLMAVSSLFFLVPGFQLLGAQPAAPDQRSAAKFKVETLASWNRKTWTVLDFRADWCTACLEMERETFPSEKISPLFERGEWNLVRVDMTKADEPEAMQVAQRYKIVSLPTVLIAKPGGEVCGLVSLYGFEGPQDFANRLRLAREECR